jgi:hypothetical protein
MDNYRVKLYLDYEVEATSEEDAVNKVAECISIDLNDGASIYDIADVEVGKVE